jgi:acyl-Coa thioesterase superfamily protein/acyl-CoA thioesterase superfamily protein
VGDAFYTPDGDWLVASELTRGPWDPGSQHAGPPSALVARAIERCGEADGFQVGRITMEIVRPVPIGRLRASARVVRPGRSVELIEATLESEEGEVMRALAWRLRTQPVELSPAPPEDPPPPGPAEGEKKPFFDTGQKVGYHTAMDYLFVHGSFLEAGPATVWMRMRQPLVEGEETTPLQRVLVAADSGNGVSAALDVRRFLFINTDLSVHLLRMPEGEWVCLEARTYPEQNGVGLSETALYDERGRIGRAAQTLLVRAR